MTPRPSSPPVRRRVRAFGGAEGEQDLGTIAPSPAPATSPASSEQLAASRASAQQSVSDNELRVIIAALVKPSNEAVHQIIDATSGRPWEQPRLAQNARAAVAAASAQAKLASDITNADLRLVVETDGLGWRAAVQRWEREIASGREISDHPLCEVRFQDVHQFWAALIARKPQLGEVLINPAHFIRSHGEPRSAIRETCAAMRVIPRKWSFKPTGGWKDALKASAGLTVGALAVYGLSRLFGGGKAQPGPSEKAKEGVVAAEGEKGGKAQHRELAKELQQKKQEADKSERQVVDNIKKLLVRFGGGRSSLPEGKEQLLKLLDKKWEELFDSQLPAADPNETEVAHIARLDKHLGLGLSLSEKLKSILLLDGFGVSREALPSSLDKLTDMLVNKWLETFGEAPQPPPELVTESEDAMEKLKNALVVFEWFRKTAESRFAAKKKEEKELQSVMANIELTTEEKKEVEARKPQTATEEMEALYFAKTGEPVPAGVSVIEAVGDLLSRRAEATSAAPAETYPEYLTALTPTGQDPAAFIQSLAPSGVILPKLDDTNLNQIEFNKALYRDLGKKAEVARALAALPINDETARALFALALAIPAA